MASSDGSVLASELNKLKKSDLIDLLINCTLPDNIVSDILLNFAKELSRKTVKKCVCDGESVSMDINNTEIMNTSIGNQFSILKLENKYLNDICIEKEKVIYNQSVAITALQQQNNLLNSLLKINTTNNENHCDKFEGQTAPSWNPIEDTINKGYCISLNVKENINPATLVTTPIATNKSNSIGQTSETQGEMARTTSAENINENKNAIQATTQKTSYNNGKYSNRFSDSNSRKKNNQIIVGTSQSLDNINLKAVPTMAYFHVFKLQPATTENDVIKHLQTDFPEVLCQKLVSKFPQEYSSFKISVNQENATSFLDPNRWPMGTRINKFFHIKKKPPSQE